MRGKVGIRFAEPQAKVEGKDRARFASLQPLGFNSPRAGAVALISIAWAAHHLLKT